MSLAGNVTHAILGAPAGAAGLAATAAVVPTLVLTGSTHSVTLLLRTHRRGLTYWCALVLTVGLAACAFVLSFDALRDLAVSVGFRPSRAWLWPVSIDASIAQSTLALLTLRPTDNSPAAQSPRPSARSDDGGVSGAAGEPQAAAAAPPDRSSAVARLTARDDQPDDAGPEPGPIAASADWRSTADHLVRTGQTTMDPELVATILAEHAAGTAPSTIGRQQKVHYTTVKRILSAAQSATL
jgi:hypothetical protein